MRHRHHTEGVGLEHFTHGGYRGGLEGADDTDPRVVDEHVDHPKCGNGFGDGFINAAGIGDVQREHFQAITLRAEDIRFRLTHRCYDIPAPVEEQLRCRLAVA